MRTVLISVFLLMAALPAIGQSVTGTVKDTTGRPLEGVLVTVSETGASTYSDAEGRYRVDIPDAKGVTVVAFLAGFEKATLLARTLDQKDIHHDFVLAPLGRSLEEVVITGVRAAADDPVAHTTIDRQQIERSFRGQDAQFVLPQLAPSLLAHTQSGGGFSNYGGLSMRGIDQTRINMTLNGVPLNDMLDQGVFFSNLPDFLNNMGSVQVQRGPGTAINGTASYAGSINFEMEKLRTELPETEVQLLGGSFGTWRANGRFRSGLINDKFAFYGSMSNTTTDGYRYHSGSDSWSMAFSGAWFGEKDMVKLTAINGRTRSQLAYFPVPQPLIDLDPRTNVNFEQDRDDFGQQVVQLQHTRFASDHVAISSSLYYGGAQGDFPFGYPDEDGNFAGQVNYPLQNRHFGLFSNVHYEKNGLSLKGGVHGYIFHRRNWETLLPDHANTIYDDSTRKSEASAFARASYTTGRLTVSGGVQVRTTQIRFFPDYRIIAPGTAIPVYNYSFLNGHAGLAWRLAEQWQAYVSFGRTGREPTRYDLLGGNVRVDSFNLAALQNPGTFEPEFVNDLEAGLRYRGRNLQFTANVFHMAFRNEIAPIGERVVFVQLRKNIPRSHRSGIELEAAWQHQNGLYASGMLTLMAGRIAEYAPDFEDTVYFDKRQVLTPAVMGLATAGYRWKKGLDVSFTGQHTGMQYIEPTNDPDFTVPTSFVLHGQVQYTFRKGHEVSLQARNLLDTRYYLYGEIGEWEGMAVPAYFVEPPRHVLVMVRLKF